jgi:uncharacterized protein YegL
MNDQTIVAFVLDKSGSMEAIKDSTIEAFNAYVEGLRKDPEGIRFSLIQFDSFGVETTWKNEPVANVPGLDGTTYVPRGGTPLIDASFKTIKAVERKVAEFADPPKVVICIQTDGEENASREHTWDDLNALIKEKLAAGWQFNFMGAGIDAYTQGARMGLSAAQTMSYDAASPMAARQAFAANAENTQRYKRGLSESTGYSAAQKTAAGDRFAPLQAPDLGGPAQSDPAKPVPKATVDDIEI